uniref:Uncharacterized protein n=1 Tax=Anguilla anguilla TaxID=7936 RepID=A0A0E9RN35_ANGAN
MNILKYSQLRICRCYNGSNLASKPGSCRN